MCLPQIESVTDELLAAADGLAKSGRWATSLVLLFCAIDTCASLVRDADHLWVERQDFIDWVNSYVLAPGCELPCTAEALYAARCSVVHAQRSESKMRTEGRVREIVYALADGAATRYLARPGGVNALSVNAQALLLAVDTGVRRFLERLRSDAALGAVAVSHAAELLTYCGDV